MILTKLFLRRKVKKLAKASFLSPHAFIPLDKVTHLLVVYHVDQTAIVAENIKHLKTKNIHINHVVYGSESLNAEDTMSHLSIGPKALNCFGFPSAAVRKIFEEMKADLIIDLTVNNPDPLRYLILSSPHAFRIGIGRAEELGYEFTLRSTEKSDLAYNFSRILFYLRSFDAK